MIIQTQKVIKDFQTPGGVVHALCGISMEVEKGKLTIFRGRSGSGKTTLLNMLGALDRPTSGSVVINDQDISKLSDVKRDELRRKDFGFIFQSTALIGMMSAYENVEFSLRVSGFKNPQERKKRAEECLTLVGLAKRMSHMPSEMSGGEQQRVAIARAMSHKPLIIYADEPTAELDTMMGLQVMGLFKTLIEKEGITVVMTTHDPNMMEIADRVYTMEDGEIVDVK
jgi:putative ABC transport system ATP-binding protein